MKKFKIVVVGCGGISGAWLPNIVSRQDTEIVALVDINEANANNVKENYKLNAGYFKDVKDAIKSTQANLVLDLTIPSVHKQVVVDSLTLGCDVFGEKPMAMDMKECEEMVETANRTDKVYSVMQNRRFNKQIRSLKGIVTSNEIGKPTFVCADFFIGAHFGGFRDMMDSPLILDMAIHTFDAARFITGADPVSVYCYEFNPEGSWYKGNVNAICVFEMSDKSVFCYRGSWCSEGFNTSWESSWRVIGTKGTAIWDGVNMPYYEVIIPSEKQEFFNKFEKKDGGLSWAGKEGHPGCIDEMFSALSEKRKAETDCTDNIKSVAMVLKAVESSKLSKRIMF